MTLTEAIAFAERADKAWQSHLTAMGIGRWSDASSARGTRAGELYENKVMADRIMGEAFAKARASIPGAEFTYPAGVTLQVR